MNIKLLKNGEVDPLVLKPGNWFAALDGSCIGIVLYSSYVQLYYPGKPTPVSSVIADIRGLPIRRANFELVEVP